MDCIFFSKTIIVNFIFQNIHIPTVLKNGIACQIFKSGGKPIDNPNSYRKITVTNPIGKMIEKLHLSRNSKTISKIQSILQKGFTEGECPAIAGLILTELFIEAIENNRNIFFALTDAQKAFDIVWHDGLFREMFKCNIVGDNWLLFKEWYNNVQTKIKWQGQFSHTFPELQGVRQGGVWSPAAYKIFINSLLKIYETEQLGARIGSVYCGVPTVADDVTLVSNDPFELQSMLDIQMFHANKQRYIISSQKSCVLQRKRNETHSWNINGQTLKTPDTATHLGIKRDNGSKTGTKEVVPDRIQTARKTVYALMGAGLHGLNGINPKVSLHLINCYVIPRLVYGLDVICLSAKDIKNLSIYFIKLMKQIQHLPERTANTGTLLLLGQIPIEAVVHKRMLCNFRNIVANKNSVEYNIANRQLAIKSKDSKSWFIRIVELTDKYELPSPHELLVNPPCKYKWKKLVSKVVNFFWLDKLKTEAKDKSTLNLLNIEDTIIGKTHNIWFSGGAEPFAVKRCNIKSKLACGTYTLQQDRAKFSRQSVSPICQLCKHEPEDREHFIIDCKVLEEVRSPFIDKLRCYIQDIASGILFGELFQSNNNLLQLIVDCSKFHFLTNQQHVHIEKISAGLCFSLHQKRSSLLE
ncbi:Hypothetical predicted protein [Mytilus galloprovincialis]|uniref:Reverse transcriptase domain-containing protein n=1 Tax=Mytilus galloprovincialis TaxID=29158 RepID=A0A8B6CG08_MYTGA|nr:Hypothetical predicted protein [Mytilus galloprovincialis]